nr:MAG TPA: hypothetical protein [Caudoviricetes sp.]
MKININLEINLNLWIARDRGGDVVMFSKKPKRNNEYDFWDGDIAMDIVVKDTYSSLSYVFPNIADYFDFSLMSWEDEPKQLKDIIKK